ncbi:MAG TPA: YggS family pyridoxal phosphate-dependent enzyme [Pyrinomonadaceae bacterium]|nr:YggS family pyridoxal phosphate-dependent enzyme [Pyrinomonadaceae bacterium]
MPEEAPSPEELKKRVAEVRRRIEASASRSGREGSEIKLIAVSKTHPAATLRRAIEVGLTDLGENRVQEADAKIREVGRERARWHLIGHLQANKARRAVELFDLIHSLDSVSLAQRLDRLCEETGRDQLPVLIQVDLGEEETKSGIGEGELEGLVSALQGWKHLGLVGLMTLPPFFEETELVRPYFRRLRQLRDDLNRGGAFGASSGELSMGMSHDYEVAVEEGATFVRVGTAIFGERQKAD